MLRHLAISNYVLIDSLDVSFSDGLSIITGETGAGKSILLGALGLVLGDRADSKSLADKKSKCIIEAAFDISQYNLKDFFYDNDLDFEPQTIIRREISVEGKSRAFINDTPVNLNVLKELSSMLIDVHSQHQTLTVNTSSFQLSVIDLFANHKPVLVDYKNSYLQFIGLTKQLAILEERENKGKAESDFIQFQFDELNSANLMPDEKENLEKELELLNHTESIITALRSVNTLISDGDNDILQSVSTAASTLQNVSKYHNALNDISTRLQSCKLELKDIASEISSLQSQFHFSADRLEIVNDRLNILNRLEQKHRVTTSNELIDIKNQLAEKLDRFNSIENEIITIQKSLNDCKKQLTKLAAALSENRKNAAIKFQKEIVQLLSSVGLRDAKLLVEINLLQEFSLSGLDAVQFLFSANKGAVPQELSKVVSGGEMSRLMLCIKSIIAKLTSLPTILFDEIDTGISGEIAFRVGNLVEKLASNMQVIAITHLPQMASKGQSHYLVYKETSDKKTKSHIKLLKQDERVVEIAKMLSGKSLTDASIKSAKELLTK